MRAVSRTCFRIRPSTLLWPYAMVCVGLSIGCTDRTPGPPPSSQVGSSVEPAAASPSSNAPTSSTASAEVKIDPITLVVVDDPELGEVCAREWQAETGGEVTLKSISRRELQGELGAWDVMLMPSQCLGRLQQQGWAEPLSASWLKGAEGGVGEILLRDATEMVRWEQQVYGVSFGSPFPMLVYRADLLAEAQVSVPRDWREYARTLEILAEPSPKESSPRVTGAQEAVTGAQEALASGSACATFFARAAAYVRDRSQVSTLFSTQDLRPRIAEPPFVRALDELAHAARTTGNVDVWLNTTHQSAAHSLVQGQCAMAITWPHIAWWPFGSTLPVPPGELRVAPLPGSKDFYHFQSGGWQTRESGQTTSVPLWGADGRIGVLSPHSKVKRTGQRLLAWLTSGERRASLATHSPQTFPYRKSHLADIGPWLGPFSAGTLGNDVANLISATHQQELWLSYPRFAQAEDYLLPLDQAIRDVVRGERTSSDALQQVSQTWEALTEQLGRPAVKASYLQSLGLGGLAK